jgi:hypothetical protein
MIGLLVLFISFIFVCLLIVSIAMTWQFYPKGMIEYSTLNNIDCLKIWSLTNTEYYLLCTKIIKKDVFGTIVQFSNIIHCLVQLLFVWIFGSRILKNEYFWRFLMIFTFISAHSHASRYSSNRCIRDHFYGNINDHKCNYQISYFGVAMDIFSSVRSIYKNT